MTLQHFIFAFMSAGLLFFGLYYLFAIIVIHKKILKKYLYFVIACVGASSYIFFELLLSLPYNDYQYLMFHKLKIFSFLFFVPSYLQVLFLCFFPKGKTYVPNALFFVFSIIAVTIPYDIFTSFPILNIVVKTPISEFVYNIGTSHITYRMFSIITLLSFIIILFQYIYSKTENKRKVFFIPILIALFSAANDFAVGAHLYLTLMSGEYVVYLIVALIFYDLLMEDRRTHLAVVELSKELKRKNEEAIRRLKITEIYTRKSLVDEIEKGNDPTKFQPNNVQIATLFADIRDFTGISEGLMPLEVVDLLNSYFNRMNNAIISHNGEIDKLMGDCIMALFKNPDDALRSAIEIRHEITCFNNTPEGRARPINNGIGLNYGEVIIGNIGSDSKMDYTVVGDIVNTASRLEALTKYYKVPLIISEDLNSVLKNIYSIRFLDEVLVKGKKHPVKIYEVYDFENDEIKSIKKRNLSALKDAFFLYQQGEFLRATEIYQHLITTSPETILDFYITRCMNLQSRKEAGLLGSWSGVYEFMDK